MLHFRQSIGVLFTLDNMWISSYATHEIYVPFQRDLQINIQQTIYNYERCYEAEFFLKEPDSVIGL